MSDSVSGHDREAQRQAFLLRLLWRKAPDTAAGAWFQGSGAGIARALATYRGNARGNADRVLGLSFPTLRELIGGESFEALAAAYWNLQPLPRGDLAWLGAGLADFISSDRQLAGEAYLADVARLDWALHRAESARDPPEQVKGLERLDGEDPENLVVEFQAAFAVLVSPWPIVLIRQAHRQTRPDRFEPVQTALACSQGQTALIWRRGWQAQVRALRVEEAAFVQSLLAGQVLAEALSRAGAHFSFEGWLIEALTEGWIEAIHPSPAAGGMMR